MRTPVPCLGLDAGGTNLRTGIFDAHGELLWHSRRQADFSGICRREQPDVALHQVLDILESVIRDACVRFPQVTAAGIGFPGFIDPATGILISSPNLPGLSQVDLPTLLQARVPLSVFLGNDAQAAAYGEYCRQPTASGALLYVGLGTGVGGGLVLEGKPYGGVHGMALELGHLIIDPGGRACGCGNQGCLEQYASATGLVRNYQALAQRVATAQEIAGLAAAGEEPAREALRQSAEALAQALAHVMKILDVADVVVGGGLSSAWPLLQPFFDPALDRALIPVLRGKIHVRASTAQDEAGMLGAARLAAARTGARRRASSATPAQTGQP